MFRIIHFEIPDLTATIGFEALGLDFELRDFPAEVFEELFRNRPGQ